MSRSPSARENLPRPSSEEWEVFRIVRALSSPTVQDVRSHQEEPLDFHSTHTLLQRLVTKGYLEEAQHQGLDVRYTLAFDGDDLLRLEMGRFLDERVGSDAHALRVVQGLIEERLRKVE